MLRVLTKFRLRAALGLVALYGVCVLAPHAALALGHGVAHCLTADHAAAHVHQHEAPPAAHAHFDGTVHDHARVPAHDDGGAPHEQPGTDGKNHGTCCGLSCVSAIAPEPGVNLPALPAVSPALPGLDNALAGHSPDRLIRPPIA